MNYFRCECGKRESWSSYGPFRCKPCPECGTTLGSGPDDHPPVEPHRWEEWRWTINETTGERSQRRECLACMTRETRTESEAMCEVNGVAREAQTGEGVTLGEWDNALEDYAEGTTTNGAVLALARRGFVRATPPAPSSAEVEAVKMAIDAFGADMYAEGLRSQSSRTSDSLASEAHLLSLLRHTPTPPRGDVEAAIEEFHEAAQDVACAITLDKPTFMLVERRKRRDVARSKLLALVAPTGTGTPPVATDEPSTENKP